MLSTPDEGRTGGFFLGVLCTGEAVSLLSTSLTSRFSCCTGAFDAELIGASWLLLDGPAAEEPVLAWLGFSVTVGMMLCLLDDVSGIPAVQLPNTVTSP